MSKEMSSSPGPDHPPPSPKNPPPKRARMQAQAGTGFNDPWINARGATQQAQSNPRATPREARERSISPLVVRRPAAPVATTNPSQAAPPISSKAIVDRFSKIEKALRELDNEHKYDTEGLQTEVNKLRDYVVELQEWTQKTAESIHNLENELLELKELVLVQHVGIGRDGDNGDSGGDAPTTKTAVTPSRRQKKRDNHLARTIRKSLKALMKRIGSQRLPDPLVVDGKVEYWLVEGQLRILRPNWDQDWDDNKVWVQEAAEKIQECGAEWNPIADAEELRKTSLEIIAIRIQATFETWKAAYQKTKLSPEEQLAARKLHRRKQRKEKKAKIRVKYRHTVPELKDSKYNHLFVWQYVSSDDTDDGTPQASAIDSGTEDNHTPAPDASVQGHAAGKTASKAKGQAAGTRVVVPRKKQSGLPFKSRPPMYRPPEIEPLVVELEENIKKQHDIKRVRGEPKDTPLPKCRKGGVHIPRHMIDEKWLAAHKEFDKPSFMKAEDGVGANEADDEESSEEEDEPLEYED